MVRIAGCCSSMLSLELLGDIVVTLASVLKPAAEDTDLLGDAAVACDIWSGLSGVILAGDVLQVRELSMCMIELV
jgi:hypothetical protein